MIRLSLSFFVDLKRTLALTAAGIALLAGGLSGAHAKTLKSAPVGMVAHCSWDHPGLRPFMGDVVGAVDRYKDIPAPVRARLKQRMAERQYDEFVEIRRDAIIGQVRYEPGIREMHFGDGRVCAVVTRSKWTPAMRERGLVYCEGEHCILVPTVCRNVSRIKRRVFAAASAPAPRRSEEPVASVPQGGGYAMYGWLVAQSRATGEPGWVSRPGHGVAPATPFLPPYSGAPGWPIGPEAVTPVPEAPTWIMMGVGALLIGAVGRRRVRKG